MDRQEGFNKAYLGLKSQGFQQSLADDGNGCMYRGVLARKCAIGHMIPDERYDQSIEGCPATSKKVVAAAGYDSFDKIFFGQLQRIHDDGVTPHKMERDLISFASRCGLTIPTES